MVLPEAVLFPHALMPLFIFEPRYRAMLSHALERERMFCVAMLKPGVTEARTEGDFFHTAGLGMVRACVTHEDGTSHLVLQGLARVCLGTLVQEGPFRIAEVQELPVEKTDVDEIDQLCAAVRTSCADLSSSDVSAHEMLNEQLAQVNDPGVLCDIVAHTFLQSSRHQQSILEEVDVAARLRRVLQCLQERKN